tara:strand:+ start:11441 stop:11737 length:297 start_codon:yes stop_codon:yes gene_type:complete
LAGIDLDHINQRMIRMSRLAKRSMPRSLQKLHHHNGHQGGAPPLGFCARYSASLALKKPSAIDAMNFAATMQMHMATTNQRMTSKINIGDPRIIAIVL